MIPQRNHSVKAEGCFATAVVAVVVVLVALANLAALAGAVWVVVWVLRYMGVIA